MGKVYKAEDIKLKRTVALKFISRAVQDRQTRTRFLQEAQAAACLNHPHINTVYEIEEVDDQIFIAMEYIEGQTLKDRIRAQTLTMEEFLDIAIQVASGLQEAHEHNFVHRDIKSSNIMITPKLQAKITDFGLVKVLQGTQITQTAQVMGTVAYMSPEQAGNDVVDQRSDLWSFGVLLYEMVSGKLPFGDGDSMVVLYAILNKPPEPIRDLQKEIPAGLENIICKCLEKRVDMRYQTAAELKADLEKLRRDGDTGRVRSHAPGSQVLLRPRRTFRRPGFLMAAGAALVLLLLAAFPLRNTLQKWMGGGSTSPSQGLAVLPINLIGGSEEDRIFCAGLYTTLTSKLVQIQQDRPAFWVVASVEILDRKITSPSEAHEVFNVDLVIAWHMEPRPDNLSVAIDLIDPRDSRTLRSAILNWEVPVRSDLQDDILGKIVSLLEIQLSPGEQSRLALGASAVTAASVYHTQGVGYLLDYHDRESLAHAAQLFERALQEDPGFALAYARLGETCWRQWKLDKDNMDLVKARDYCERALDMAQELAQVHITLGMIHRDTGDLKTAVLELGRALQLEPRNADAHRELAVVYQNMGELKNAEKHFGTAIDINPAFWGGYSHLGAFYYVTGRPTAAEEMFLKVTRLAPDNVRGYNNLGGIYFAQGQLDRAEALLRQSLEIKPNAGAYSNLGAVYFSQAHYGKATEMFESGIKLGRNDYRIWGNLGDARRYTPGQGFVDIESAYRTGISLARSELSANSQNQAARSSLAFYYAAVGEAEKALTEMLHIQESGTEDVTVLRKCLRACEIMKMRDMALQYVKLYFEAGGSLKELQDNPDLADIQKDPRYRSLLD